MNRFTVAFGVALAVAAVPAAPATAQTRVAVMLGFALPRPQVSGVIVVGPPYGYDAESEVLVVPAPRRYQYRRPFGWERREYRGYREERGHRRHRRDRDDGEYDGEHGDHEQGDE